MHSDVTEVKVPAGLLVAGIVLFTVYVYWQSDAMTTAMAHVALGIVLTVQVALGLVACLITAKFLSVSFGNLGTAILKLAAIFLFPSTVALFIPSPPLAWLISMGLYLSLLALLFELEGWEIIVCAAMIWLVSVAAKFAVVMAMS